MEQHGLKPLQGLALTAKARARLVKEASNKSEIAGALAAGVSFFSGASFVSDIEAH